MLILSCEWKSNQEWLTKLPHAWLIEWKIPKMLLTSKIFVPVSQLNFTLISMSLISHVCHFSFSNNFFHLTNSIFNLICCKCSEEISHGYQRKKGGLNEVWWYVENFMQMLHFSSFSEQGFYASLVKGILWNSQFI